MAGLYLNYHNRQIFISKLSLTFQIPYQNHIILAMTLIKSLFGFHSIPLHCHCFVFVSCLVECVCDKSAFKCILKLFFTLDIFLICK